MNNENVVQNWRDGKKGKSGNGNLATDGYNLYSYKMLIGVTETGSIHKSTNGEIYKSNYKYSLNVTSPDFYSVTTSHHCSLAKRYADEIIKPIKSRIGYSVWYYFPDEYLKHKKDTPELLITRKMSINNYKPISKTRKIGSGFMVNYNNE